MVVADYLGYAFTEVADELGLPTVVYMPNSIKGYSDMTNWMIPTHENTCACCGMVCLCPKHISSNVTEAGFNDLFAQMRHRLVLSNSFFGFEKAAHIPPNLVCTGPTMSNDIAMIEERLNTINPDLQLWLQQAVNEN